MAGKKRVFRNEWKYLISHQEADLLQQRLMPYVKLDKNAVNGEYMIRSLYFDDYSNSAYNEKLMGVNFRKKWRIRVYNCSDSYIMLERKIKVGSYIQKSSARLTREEFFKIIDFDYEFLLDKVAANNLYGEFYYECIANALRPKVIVDYDRVPLVYDAGTVRITLDKRVRASYGSFDIFDDSLPIIPAIDFEKLVLEVKFTEFLPGIIQSLLPVAGQEFTAFSKYVACYEAVHHVTDPTAGITKTEILGRKY